MNGYQQAIAEECQRLGLTNVEPRWVEAFMRLEWGTLDHLPRSKFAEVARDVGFMLSENLATPADLNRTAESFGL